MAEVAALGLRVDGVSNIDQAEKSLSDFSRSAASADKSSSQLAKTSGGLNSAYDRLNGSLSRAAKSMLALGAATVSLAAASRTLSGFEDSMAQVAAITRATTSELEAMRDMAKSLGATTKFSASEAADGIRFLGMAGFSASESLASIPAVLNLATASAMGLADAADIATNIMSGFGIQAQNAANVADVLAAASSRSNTTVQQLGGAMSTVAPISAALGISLEDTAAAIGTLSDAGIQGERAGTAMRGALASLAGPTTQAQQVLKSLGLTIQDVNPQTNDLATVFGRLNEAGLNTAQAMTIFGREAASGALVLTQAAGRVGEFGDILRNAGGEAQRMADIMADSLAGDFKNLQSSIEGIIIAMGEAGLITIMRSVIQLGTELIRSITNVVNGFGRLAGYVGSALEPALNALSHILTTVARNADAIVVAMAAMYAPAVLGGIATLTKAIGVGLVGAVNALTAAMMANPIGFLIRVLATATAAIFVFRDDVNRIFGIQIPSSFREMALAGAWVMDSLLGGFTGNVAAIWSLFVTLGTNMWTFFENIFNQIREAASAWVHGIAQDLNKLPFVSIELGDQYKAPKPSGYLGFAEEMERAFQAGQKYLGLRENLALSFAEDDIWAAGAQAAEEYSKVINNIAGGGGGGEGSGGGGLPAATDALRKWLAESQNATAAANLMTAAYLQGGEAIASATRQIQIEQQVLEHGASSRNAVTAAINAQTAALDRQDIAQQINDLREQNKAAQDYLAVLAAQSRGHQQGRQALAAFNREQAQAAILAGKTADEVADLVAQYDRLFVESQAIQDATSAMNELNRLVESTRTSQEKYNIELQRLLSLRPYAQTAEQAEALERAIANIQRENSQWISFTEDALERINKSFADMWRDAFEGSRNAFEGMKRGFRQMLAEMAHAAITQPIMITVGNALMGTNNAGGILDGGGIFGMAKNANTAFQGIQKATSAISNFFGAGSAISAAPSALASLSTTLNSATIATTKFAASLSGGAVVPGLGVSAAGGGVGAAGTASSFISGLSTAAPWIAGGLMVANAFGLFDDRLPTTRRSQRGASHMLPDGSFEVAEWDDRQTEASQKAARDFAQAAVKHANELFQRIGIDASIYSFQTLMESSILGDKQGVGSSGILRLGESLIDIGLAVESSWTRHGVGGWSDAEMLPRLVADINLTLLEAFQKAGDELPNILSSMLEGVDIRSLDISQAEQLIELFSQTVNQIDQFIASLDSLPFEYLRDITFDAAANIMGFAGGLDNLQSGISNYFENFYSLEERIANETRLLTEAFASVSLTLPDLTMGADRAKAEFRAMVESLDPLTEEGQRGIAMAYNLSGRFADLVEKMDSLGGAASNLDSLISGFMGDARSALNAVQEHGRKQIEKLQESFARTDDLMNAVRSRVQQVESHWRSALDTMSKSVRDLRGQIEATARIQYEQARATISSALAAGRIPAGMDIQDVIRSAQQGVTGGTYRTAFEQRRAYLTLANEIEALHDIAKPELDTAVATLEQLEKQYNLLRGIEDYSGLSLKQLEEQLQSAFRSEAINIAQIERIERQIAMAQLQYQQLVGINEELSTLPGALSALANAVNAANAAREAANRGNAVDRETRYLANNPDVLDQYLKGYGGSMSAAELARYHYETYGRFEGRAFARGGIATPGWALVGEEGPELVNFNQTGRVYSASHSEDIMRSMMGGGAAAANARVVQVLQSMFDYMKGKQQQEYQDSLNLKRTADRLDTLEQAVMNDGGLVMVGY